MKAVTEWTTPKFEHASVVESEAFKHRSFLVEYVNGKTGCSCLARTERVLGVFLGVAVAIMIRSPDRWRVTRFGIIDTREG